MMGIRRSVSGFTLIELMIVVVVVAILAAIAYPAYTEQVRDSRRSETQGMLMDLAASLEAYRAKNFSYDGATASSLAPKLASSDFYNVAITTSNNDQAYTVTATTKTGSVMEGGGALVINSQGQTCRVKGASTCTPSSSTSWKE